MYSLLLLGVSAGLLLCLLLQPIEVTDVIAVLDNTELLELTQSMIVGLVLEMWPALSRIWRSSKSRKASRREAQSSIVIGV